MRVGITGQSGFIGYHLANYLSTKREEIEIISYSGDYFSDPSKLRAFANECDVIVHLAGLNRGPDNELYDTNVHLASALIKSTEENSHKPRIIFASSTQEERDNSYGKSKRDASNLFIDWAERNDSTFNALIIPNVFGPFCKPFYNSVVATFCYQLTHGQEPRVENDAILGLIYVNDLVEHFYHTIITPTKSYKINIDPTENLKVSQILSKLIDYKTTYFDNHIIPNMKDQFSIQLLNTFRSYIDLTTFPIKVKPAVDERGSLFEVIKENNGGQSFYSYTHSGKTRGNHYHRRKIERFFVVKGSALIKIRKIGTDKTIDFILNDNCPSFIDIPVFYTHNITNIGDSDLVTFFWTNEIFNKQDTDTFYDVV